MDSEVTTGKHLQMFLRIYFYMRVCEWLLGFKRKTKPRHILWKEAELRYTF